MSEIATIPYPKVTHIKKRAFLQALEGSLGIVAQAVKQSGNLINRETHYEWLKTDPDYAEAVASVGEHVLDFAESALHKNISLGKEQSLVFFLKTRGKSRGYSVFDEAESVGRNTAPPIINIIMPQQNSGFIGKPATIIEMTGDCGLHELETIPKALGSQESSRYETKSE